MYYGDHWEPTTPEEIEKAKKRAEKQEARKKELNGYFAKDVEQVLGITATERKRWTEEGKLQYNGKSIGVYTPWKNVSVDLYDRTLVDSITQTQIDEWRADHKREISEKRKRAAKKAVKTRAENKKIEKTNNEKIEKILNKYGRKNCAIIKMLYFLATISDIADEYAESGERGEANELYLYKNETLKMLLENEEELFDVSLYMSDEVKRNVNLCPDHYEMFKEDWNMMWGRERFCKYDLINYYYQHNKCWNCKECEEEIDKDYYSLYKIKFELGEYKALFNLPYPLARKYLPSKYCNDNMKILSKLENTKNSDECCYELNLKRKVSSSNKHYSDASFEKDCIRQFEKSRQEYLAEVKKY